MVHSWQQTISIDKRLAIQLIEKQIGIKVDAISSFGEGWDNVAYLVNNKYVFRFPRRQMGVECMENEINVLPYIKDKVSFPFSYPQFVGAPTASYSAPFAGYQLLPGMPLSEVSAELVEDKKFAQQLALLLKELHSISVPEECKKLIKGDQSWRYNVPQRIEKLEKVIKQYGHFFKYAGFNLQEIMDILDKAKSLNFDNAFKASFCHGDLYSRHILVDKNKSLTGIIDWGDIHIGNPGTDLSIAFLIFSEKNIGHFFDCYGSVDTEIMKIAMFRAFWHPIMFLPYCYEQKEERLKNWTVLALKQAISFIKEKIYDF